MWSPYFVCDIDNLERVQRRATKLVNEFTKLSYENRLKKLGIYSLYCRRQRGDLIETYKILNGYYNVKWTKFFSLSLVQSTRGHQQKLFKKPNRFQLRSNFFTQRIMWNSLSGTVVSATNVSSFKQKLQEYWTDIGYGYVCCVPYVYFIPYAYGTYHTRICIYGMTVRIWYGYIYIYLYHMRMATILLLTYT